MEDEDKKESVKETETKTSPEEDVFADSVMDDEDSSSSDDFDLSEFDEEYEESEAQGGFDDIPNGIYQAKIFKVYKDKSSQGNKMLKWRLEIFEGDFATKVIGKHSMIMTKQNLGFLKGDLEKAGADMSQSLSVQTSSENLAKLLGNIVEISVKNQTDNPPNIFFQKLISEGELEEVVE